MNGETRLALVPALDRVSAPWQLDLNAQRARLLDADGVLVTVIPRDAAVQRITLPSHSEGREYLILTTIEGKTLEFEADELIINIIEGFRSHSGSGDEHRAVDSLRRSARRNLIAGGVAILIGAGLSIQSYLETIRRGGSVFLLLGLVFYGLLLVGKGAYALVRANRLAAYAMESRAEVPVE